MTRRALLVITAQIFIVFASLFIIDSVLGYFGFPSDFTDIAYPSYLRSRVKNITYEYVLNTNNMGLRYKNVSLKKPGGVFRVFVVGDSSVEGTGVKAEDSFCSLIEDDMKKCTAKVDVINGGMAGTGPQEYNRMFGEVGKKYDPDLVLICIFANDLTNINIDAFKVSTPGKISLVSYMKLFWPRIYCIYKQYMQTRLRVSSVQPLNFTEAASAEARRRGLSEERIETWKKSLPNDLVKAANRREFNTAILTQGLLNPGYWSESLDIDTELAEKRWAIAHDNIENIIGACHSNGVSIGMIFIPSPLQYDPSAYEYKGVNIWTTVGVEVRDDWVNSTTELQKRIEGVASEHRIPFLDLTPTFRDAVGEGKKVCYKLDGHWNADGHRVAAAAIIAWLKEISVVRSLCLK